MRKILSLIGIIAMSSTSVMPVVACKNENGGAPSSTQVLPINFSVKKWAQESSVVAKTLLVSKQSNINTNNLLNYILKNNQNNIKHDVDNTSDDNSYKDFSHDWFYNGTITGNIAEKNFVDNNSPTIIDTFNKTKETISPIKTYLPIIRLLTPERWVTLLNSDTI